MVGRSTSVFLNYCEPIIISFLLYRRCNVVGGFDDKKKKKILHCDKLMPLEGIRLLALGNKYQVQESKRQ